MASLHVKPLLLHQVSLSTQNWRNKNCIKPLKFSQPCYSRNFSMSIAATTLNSSQSEPEKPEIELEFVAPKAGDDTYLVQKVFAISGEKLLRNIMLDNKIELYAAYGKVMNCGGGGSCGTCLVEIIDGKDLLNERTDIELRYLKKKPDAWRLACQTIVGNKENSGKVVIQRMPQWRK